MKKILVSTRVDVIESYQETRDAIDERWTKLLLSAGFFLVFVPNDIQYVKNLLDLDAYQGLLLTGGNSLHKYGGNAPQRDEVELYLLKHFIDSQIPVLGVCRGMQLILDYYGEALEQIENHTAVRHKLLLKNQGRLSHLIAEYSDVNSYHDWGTKSVSSQDLIVSSVTEDGVIESVEDSKKQVFGQMWHPEREPGFNPLDIQILNFIFGDN